MLHVAKPTLTVIPAFAAAVTLSLFALLVRGQAGTPSRVFVIHGTPKNCAAISQLDNALFSNYQPFFSGWNEKDYADAIAWADACADYGWHIAGRPRLPLLRAQRGWALKEPATPVPAQQQVPAEPQIISVTEADFVSSSRTKPMPRGAAGPTYELPADGAVVGADATIRSHYADTLPDIARRYSLGYEEIVRANPGVDVWVPGEGTRIVLPGRRILPPGVRDGVVVNLAEHRLYYFPKPRKEEKPVVITYPVSIGKTGEDTPLGQSRITAKIKNPTWYPPASVRREHAASGDPLPAAVGPGPDNPLGEYMMRLGFGHGTYEIHGTNKPVAVGMANTDGCIGMYPEDMASLFAMVPVGTVVRFINVPVALRKADGVIATVGLESPAR